MKRVIVILIILVFYFASLVISNHYSEEYVYDKFNKAELEIRDKLYNLFEDNERYVDAEYIPVPVRANKLPIPKMSDITIDEDKPYIGNHVFLKNDNKEFDTILQKEYNYEFKHLKSLYNIPCGIGSDGRLMVYTRWNFKILHYMNNEVFETSLFPYAVGYKTPEDYYVPELKDILKSAYTFYVTDEESKLRVSIENGSYKRITNELLKLSNNYFYINTKIDTLKLISPLDKPLMGCLEISHVFSKFDFKHNSVLQYNDYSVFIGEAPYVRYFVDQKDPKLYENEIYQLRITWFSILTLFSILMVGPLLYLEIKRKESLNESIYDRLKKLCNPTLYLKDYNKEKIDYANNLYKRITETAPDDQDALLLLVREAEEKLRVNFVDARRINLLKKRVNPKLFMNPYQSEKVSLANELYAILNKEKISYADIIEVEKKLVKLQ